MLPCAAMNARRIVAWVTAPLLAGCGDVACWRGADRCEVPSPCADLSFSCDDGSTEAYVLDDDDPLPGGVASLAATGDVVLANDQIVAVIEAIDHPHYIAPTGGNLIDLTRRGQAHDALRHLFLATGLLPEDAPAYDTLQVLDEGDVKAVLVTGRLDGYPDAYVATRYEVRPCEPGIRIRTEVLNLGPDPLSWFVADAWYFGGRGSLPFTPGAGFEHPSFGLTTINDAFRDAPYLATSPIEGAAAYAEIACDGSDLSGFHSAEISAVGREPTVVYPRDWVAFERFVAVGDGPGASAAVDVALDVRRLLFDEPYATLSGTVDLAGRTVADLEASIVVYEGSGDDRLAHTQIVPDDGGNWAARVPTSADYTLELRAFGRVVDEVDVSVGDGDATADPLAVPAVGEVTIDATIDGAEDHVLVFVHPADDATLEATRGDWYGYFSECAPYLGHPHGSSPACNRVLVTGPTTVALQPGTYDFFASAGPFSTLAAARGVVVTAGTGQSVALDLEMLPVAPEGTLSGDFHVHGAASFDAELNDVDRARAFLASRVDVIATTEHDAVWDYAEALEKLDAADRLVLITGTESTGHILFPLRSDSAFPRVIGHWNFWPVRFDPRGAWRGAAWDELVEPGALFTRQAEVGWDEDVGVIELNHPVGGLQFGRDFGWFDAAGIDLTRPLETTYDGTGQSLYLRTPDGASFSNADYHVQEVMNGTNNGTFLGYRAVWHYLLDQGVVKGGVANSDSHTLTENVLGTPRTLVWSDNTVADFDLAAFDDAMRRGRMLGTNGPVIVAEIRDGDASYTPSTDVIALGAGARLHIDVTAAPWVPVDEVRVLVNGSVVRTWRDLAAPDDPLGSDGVDRGSVAFELDEVLPADGDAWIVVEAGHALEPNEDLDCDGVPDTGDNNRDGVIDWRDVEGLEAEPDVDCFDTVGPMTDPPEPDPDTPAWWFRTVTPGGYPLAFTNPFVLDLDGDGAFTGRAE